MEEEQKIALAENIPDMRAFSERLFTEEDQRGLDTLIGEAVTYLIYLQDAFNVLRARTKERPQ